MATTLITGSNRGIGFEFARQYAQKGWNVIACCRQPESASNLRQLADNFPGLVTIHQLDVADHNQITRLSNNLENTSIDLLINNAGIYPSSDDSGFGEIDYEAWHKAFQINTMAPLRMAEAFLAQISKSQLKIIAIITSKMGSIDDNKKGGSYIYRSSKAAVNMVGKSLSIDLEPQGITTVILHPGWVRTDMGGPDALISPEQSVLGMQCILSNLKLSDSGKFFAYDGKIIPW